MLSKEELKAKVSETYSKLDKETEGGKGLLAEGYGLLDNYAHAKHTQTNELGVATVNKAMDAVKGVVDLVNQSGHTAAEITKASGEIIASIGAVLTPFTGPVGGSKYIDYCLD